MKLLLELIKKAAKMTIYLIKIILPVSVFVKILQMTGLVEKVAYILQPFMKLVGLPGEFGIVWMTAMLTNIYGGLVTLFNLCAENSYTAAQITVLATMIVFAHSFFVETKILTAAGGNLKWIIPIRVANAFVVGIILNIFFKATGMFGELADMVWVPKQVGTDFFSWGLSQAKNFYKVFLIILSLLVVMEIFERLGLVKLINKLIKPLLKLMGISEKASYINIIALALGISYGGAMLIEETKNGDLDSNDVFYSIVFVSLCHALVEDSLLMMVIGAKSIGVFWLRLIYPIIFVGILNKFKVNFLKKESEFKIV